MVSAILCIYLHGTAQTEDAVVGILGLKALQSGLDEVVLLGEQVIGPAGQFTSAHQFAAHRMLPSFF